MTNERSYYTHKLGNFKARARKEALEKEREEQIQKFRQMTSYNPYKIEVKNGTSKKG